MSLLHAIVLGIIQGLTEFLPISSSAHLIIVPWILGWEDGGLTFDVALHAGTLVAVVLFFFRDWIQIIGQGLGLTIGRDPALQKNRGLLWLLVIATIPGALAGFLFEKQADAALRSPYIIATSAIVMGLIMWVADSVGAQAEGHLARFRRRRPNHRRVPGVGDHPRRLAQRSHHQRRPAPQSGPGVRRAILVPALDADHRGRVRQEILGSAQA